MNAYKYLLTFVLAALLSGCCCFHTHNTAPKESKGSGAPRIVNIINFIRQTEPRSDEDTDEVLYQTTAEQVKIMTRYDLKGTFLLQYDALINPQYQALMKEELARGSEVGAWWEITQPHVEAIGLKWRGRYPWDWHANVGFATGYTPKEREMLVDEYMSKFKEIFGFYPASVGSWFIDAHSLAYMSDKYHIIASCTCKDQIGTDGYTMWGGYWGGGYYASRKNAYMPAQTREGQIPVPIFRMLGSDPIYQYESGLGGQTQGVVSLEPVYWEGGGSQEWVDWFFEKMFDDPCLGYTYTQAGQENSFTWKKMKQGYEIQMPSLAKLKAEGKIRIETLAESGTWFRKLYPVNPATAQSALTDHKKQEKKTVWFNSRFYRANLLWEGSNLTIRDIHLFNEDFASDYIDKAGTSTQCIYTTLPFVDGFVWSSAEKRAGLRLYSMDSYGKHTLLQGKTPVITSGNKTLQVEWQTLDEQATFVFTFTEGEMIVVCKAKDPSFQWNMELTTAPGTPLPFLHVDSQTIQALYKDFPYQITCKQGSCIDTRKPGQDTALRLEPKDQTITLGFKTK